MIDYTTLFDSQPSREQLSHAFDSLEADITYIDADDIVRYYSPFRIFARPSSCLESNVYSCHPTHVHADVTDMLDAFRAGAMHHTRKETVASDGRAVRVCYHGMRDRSGAYLGCLEVVTYLD